MPTEPPSTPWAFPDLDQPSADPIGDLIGSGADLAPGTLLAAYRQGYFPMPDEASGDLTWWSPQRRGILPLDGLRITRSLRQSVRRYELRVDTAFTDVMRGCASPSRDGAWIDDDFVAAYGELHRLGWAHSVETWLDGRLVGGLYGVSIGGLFAGESMFHLERDASKVALVGLVDLLRDEHAAGRVLDVQWSTPHLASLGVVELSRRSYLERLRRALALPLPAAWLTAPSGEQRSR